MIDGDVLIIKNLKTRISINDGSKEIILSKCNIIMVARFTMNNFRY